MRPLITPITLLATTAGLLGCGNNSGPGQSNTVVYDPPSTEFVTALGITPPVTGDQAMAIAAEAAGGTALSVGQETEGGELFFEVQVQTSTGGKEVEVRASDGGVVEIEPADGD
jgi:uncharacterized membrane protein YkoI